MFFVFLVHPQRRWWSPCKWQFSWGSNQEVGLGKTQLSFQCVALAELAPVLLGLNGQVLSLTLVMRWTEPAHLLGSCRAGGSSLLSKISPLTTPCITENSWESEQTCGKVVEETWRLFRLLVGFLYWILGASISSSPPFFQGRLSIILAETQAPSTGNLQVILDQQQIISALSGDCW